MRSTTKKILLKYVAYLIVKRIQPPKFDKTFFFHPFFKQLGNYINNTGHQKEKMVPAHTACMTDTIS